MKITVNKAAHLPLSYSESGQVNPLRWQALYKNEEGTFEDQTGVFKCKDYFNDIVAKYLDIDTCAYGFDTQRMKYNEEGVYVICSQLNHIPEFLNNVKLISSQAQTQGFPALTAEKVAVEGIVANTNCLLFFPREYFRSSYITSLLSYLVRVAHCNKAFTTFQDFVGNHPTKTVDHPFQSVHNKVMETLFEEPVKDCWTYLGKTKKDFITKKNAMDYSTSLHNAGCYYWHHYLTLDL